MLDSLTTLGLNSYSYLGKSPLVWATINSYTSETWQGDPTRHCSFEWGHKLKMLWTTGLIFNNALYFTGLRSVFLCIFWIWEVVSKEYKNFPWNVEEQRCRKWEFLSTKYKCLNSLVALWWHWDRWTVNGIMAVWVSPWLSCQTSLCLITLASEWKDRRKEGLREGRTDGGRVVGTDTCAQGTHKPTDTRTQMSSVIQPAHGISVLFKTVLYL